MTSQPENAAMRWGLLTDLYQLTMAYAYWKEGLHERRAAFHLFFRENPFGGGFAIACGLAAVVEYLDALSFEEADVAYLASLRGNDDKPLFSPGFLDYLRSLRFACDLDAIPEGRWVFPQEPLVRVEGPIAQCQLIETALLNCINFQSLIATKATRMCLAAGQDPVVEFGLRRAQGVDGALAASRAAYVGGCAGTSNVLAGFRYQIPVYGTHAHSWVMAFEDEPAAFDAYVRALPNNATLLVDTYDSLAGVRHAIEASRALHAQGHRLAGIRLDSGDLAYLSIEARRMLDAAGLVDTKIVASNNLDEHTIQSLKEQGARIDIWGVGTKLVTAYDQPALGGVFKLGSIVSDGRWQDRIKLSEQSAKVTTPGRLGVRRYRDENGNVGDLIYDARLGVKGSAEIVDPSDPTRRKKLGPAATFEDLLVPIYRGGERLYLLPSLEEAREVRADELACFHPSIRRFLHPHEYPVGLEPALHSHRSALVRQARGH